MIRTIYLVRHGKQEHAAGDPPLSDLGRRQAEAVAEYLTELPVEAVFTSPLLRTRQTTEIIGNKLKIVPVESDLLIERANWGDVPNQPFEDFLDMWEKASLERDWQPPFGDTSRGAGLRLQKAIDTLGEGCKQVVLVTHGGIITDLLHNEFGNGLLERKLPGMNEPRQMAIKHASVTTILYDPDEDTLELSGLGEAGYLGVSSD